MHANSKPFNVIQLIRLWSAAGTSYYAYDAMLLLLLVKEIHAQLLTVYKVCCVFPLPFFGFVDLSVNKQSVRIVLQF